MESFLQITQPLQDKHIFVNQINEIRVAQKAVDNSFKACDLSTLKAKLFFHGDERKNEVKSSQSTSSEPIMRIVTGALAGDEPAAKRQRAAHPTRLRFYITETSKFHHNRSFVLQVYLPGNPKVVPVYTQPFKVVTYKLRACQPLDNVFYKDKGGKKKCMHFKLRLEDVSGNHMTGLTFPLTVKLVYNAAKKAQPQPPQDILELMNSPVRMTKTGSATVDFRINDVSRNHLSQKFGLVVGPDLNLVHKHQDVGPAYSTFVEVLSKKNPMSRRTARERKLKKQLPKPVMDLFQLGGATFPKEVIHNDQMPETPRKCLQTMNKWNQDAVMLLDTLAGSSVGSSRRCVACNHEFNPQMTSANQHAEACPIKHLLDYHNRRVQQCSHLLNQWMTPALTPSLSPAINPSAMTPTISSPLLGSVSTPAAATPVPLTRLVSNISMPSPSSLARLVSTASLTSASGGPPTTPQLGRLASSASWAPPMPDMMHDISLVFDNMNPSTTNSTVKFIVAANVDKNLLPDGRCKHSLTRMPAFDIDKQLVGLYLDDSGPDFNLFMRLCLLDELNLSDQAITKCEEMIHNARAQNLHSLDDHLDDMRSLEETAYAQLNSVDDNFSARTDAQLAHLTGNLDSLLDDMHRIPGGSTPRI